MLDRVVFVAFCIIAGLFLGFFMRAHKASIYFRSFIPSWRFFENLGVVPTLWVRMDPKDDQETGTPWEPAILGPQKGFSSLFVNPEGNLFHANETLIRSYSLEPEDESLQARVSYLARREALRLFPEVRRYQYKVVLREQTDSGKVTHEDQILSSVREIE